AAWPAHGRACLCRGTRPRSEDRRQRRRCAVRSAGPAAVAPNWLLALLRLYSLSRLRLGYAHISGNASRNKYLACANTTDRGVAGNRPKSRDSCHRTTLFLEMCASPSRLRGRVGEGAFGRTTSAPRSCSAIRPPLAFSQSEPWSDDNRVTS